MLYAIKIVFSPPPLCKVLLLFFSLSPSQQPSLSCIWRHCNNNNNSKTHTHTHTLSISLGSEARSSVILEDHANKDSKKYRQTPVQRQSVLVWRPWVAPGRASSPPPHSTHPLPPSSCYSWPVNGLNSTDFCLALNPRRKKSDTVLLLGLTDGWNRELAVSACLFPTHYDQFSICQPV